MLLMLLSYVSSRCMHMFHSVLPMPLLLGQVNAITFSFSETSKVEGHESYDGKKSRYSEHLLEG
jgi:hypothetical protein